MNKADLYLIQNIKDILENGSFDESPRGRYEPDGAPAHSKFITHVFETYDISKNEYPIPTLMPTAIKSGMKEIMWIYKDQTSSLDVLEKKYNVSWWNPWDIGDRTIGQRYGATVRRYSLMDKLLKGLEKDPFGRRHIMNLLQETDLQETTGLYPCAFQTIWSVRRAEGSAYFLDMLLDQRSNDYLTAGYINKIQYVTLMEMVCAHLRSRGMEIFPGKFSHLVANLHIYNRHLDEAEHILTLEPLEGVQASVKFDFDTSFYDLQAKNFIVEGHQAYPRSSKLELAL